MSRSSCAPAEDCSSGPNPMSDLPDSPQAMTLALQASWACASLPGGGGPLCCRLGRAVQWPQPAQPLVCIPGQENPILRKALHRAHLLGRQEGTVKILLHCDSHSLPSTYALSLLQPRSSQGFLPSEGLPATSTAGPSWLFYSTNGTRAGMTLLPLQPTAAGPCSSAGLLTPATPVELKT